MTYNLGMAARSRDSVHRSLSSESRMTYTEFVRHFPDNDTCLEYLKEKYYADGTVCPGCERPTKFHRIKTRAAYSCQFCGKQVYPTAGTIFEKSTVSLHLWFYAIFLMSSTRCGMAAKQLEREIGVTYKTAHRMFKLIRSMLMDDDEPLSGEVEVDETYFGAKRRNAPRGGRPGEGDEKKVPVLALVERGGRVRAKVVANVRRTSLLPVIEEHVEPGSTIYTDELRSYYLLDRRGYQHMTVRHGEGEYVRGHVHTNTVEGYFGLIKGGLRGVYRGAVRRQYLQSYLDEYCFRYNHRHTITDRPMFWNFLDQIVTGLDRGPGLAAQ